MPDDRKTSTIDKIQALSAAADNPAPESSASGKETIRELEIVRELERLLLRTTAPVERLRGFVSRLQEEIGVPGVILYGRAAFSTPRFVIRAFAGLALEGSELLPDLVRGLLSGDRPTSLSLGLEQLGLPADVLKELTGTNAVVAPIHSVGKLTGALALVGVREGYWNPSIKALVSRLVQLVGSVVDHDSRTARQAVLQVILQQLEPTVLYDAHSRRVLELNRAGRTVLEAMNDGAIGHVPEELPTPELEATGKLDAWTEYDFSLGFDQQYTARSRVIRYQGTPLVLAILRTGVTSSEQTRILKQQLDEVSPEFGHAIEGFWGWNLEDAEMYFSSAWVEMTGHTREEVAPTLESWFALIHPDELTAVQKELADVFDGLKPQFETEYRIRHKSGEYFWVHSRAVAVQDSAGKITKLTGSQFDVSERKQLEEKLWHAAFHDPLTKLPNRALFVDRLGRCVSRLRRRRGYNFAVLFLDLDRFKPINDNLGHSVGDEVLFAVARRIENCIREGDTAARLGGDEFTVILEDTTGVVDAILAADRILRELANPIHVGGREILISASIGVAVSDESYHNADQVLRDADAAMYRAKSDGRSRCVLFNSEMHEQELEESSWERPLRDSVDHENIGVKFQLVAELASGRTVGFEALARWNHPEYGEVPASKFMALAKKTHLIIPLGNMVLRRACWAMADWRTRFPQLAQLTISVNVSSAQLRDEGFLGVVTEVLQESGLPGPNLCLEMTEGVLLDESSVVLRQLTELQKLGVRVALDDFGTGYSSLGCLQRLNVDLLKIDPEMVQTVLGDGQAMIKAIISFAHSMGLTVVAEGVETLEQKAALQALNCDLVQGFFFSKPLDDLGIGRLIATVAPDRWGPSAGLVELEKQDS